MEVTEAPPALMEVDSTILERVDKVSATKIQGGLSQASFPGGEGGDKR